MFDNLSKKLSDSFDKLRRKGVLSEADVDTAMREVRIALLEADVALPVVKEFVTKLKEKAVGAQIVATVNPAQMVIKLVHDELVELLGGKREEGPAIANYAAEINLAAAPPAVILMCGLQGSGKTTSTAKLAKRLTDKQRKRVLVASLDVYRPAAQEQLAMVAQQAGVQSLEIIPGQQPRDITSRALDAARKGGYDVLILDTAGRLHVDDALMQELKDVQAMAKPIETLLVADALTGQDAVNIAKSFNDAVGVTGIILTRLDGDARGGAALSMRQVTGQPIKFMGLGEKIDAFEPFHPERIAGRILDKGDVVSLVERAAEVLNEKDAEEAGRRMMAGAFDMNDMLKHMQQIKKMGGVGSMLNLMPGMGKIKEAMAGQQIDEKNFARQEAIIQAMTKKERLTPTLLNASRRKRIAAGSGTTVQDVNRLVKQYQQMETLMKQMKKMGGKGMMNPLKLKQMLGNLGG
jgi:signal recognition particle subunit SRP54